MLMFMFVLSEWSDCKWVTKELCQRVWPVINVNGVQISKFDYLIYAFAVILPETLVFIMQD